RGPVSSPSCDRRTCGERAHRCHRRFFSPALGPPKPHLKGTKDPAECETPTEARQAVCVCQTPPISHTGMMPDFLAREISSKPCPEPFSRTERYNFTHSNPRRALVLWSGLAQAEGLHDIAARSGLVYGCGASQRELLDPRLQGAFLQE